MKILNYILWYLKLYRTAHYIFINFKNKKVYLDGKWKVYGYLGESAIIYFEYFFHVKKSYYFSKIFKEGIIPEEMVKIFMDKVIIQLECFHYDQYTENFIRKLIRQNSFLKGMIELACYSFF